MILLWNSADMNVSLSFVENDDIDTIQWQADRTLARDMLSFVHRCLEERGLQMQDVKGIGVFRGPGSFTGLRIGLTVLNTWAHSQGIPIVGSTGDDWTSICLDKLAKGEDDQIVLPEYGAPAHTTKPRK